VHWKYFRVYNISGPIRSHWTGFLKIKSTCCSNSSWKNSQISASQKFFELQSIMSRAQYLTVSTSFIANIFSLRGTERAFALSWIVCCNFASKTLISSFNLPVVACERKKRQHSKNYTRTRTKKQTRPPTQDNQPAPKHSHMNTITNEP
jgi:hypothetical protein